MNSRMEGRPIYAHRSQMDNRTLNSLFLFPAIFLGCWVMALIYYIYFHILEGTSPPLLLDPFIYILVLTGIFVFSAPFLWLYLYNTPRFTITTKGILTPYSRYRRFRKRIPPFIRYEDIMAIFPQFTPSMKRADGRVDPDLLESFIVLMKSEGRITIPLGTYGSIVTKDTVEEMKKVLDRAPDGFREKWSELPILSPEEKEMMKLIQIRMGKFLMTSGDKVDLALVIILSCIFIIGLVIVLAFKDLQDWWDILLVLAVFIPVLLMIPVGIRSGIRAQEKSRVKGHMDLMNLVRDREGEPDDDSLYLEAPMPTWEGKKEIPPLGSSEVEETVRKIDAYKPRLMMFVMISGFILTIGGVLPLAAGLSGIGPANPFMIAGLAIISTGILMIASCFFFFGEKDIMKMRANMEDIIADEIKEGRDILPDGYQPPLWFKLRRGPEPLPREEYEKMRRWMRLDPKRERYLVLLLSVGGLVFMFGSGVLIMMILETILVIFVLAAVPVVTFTYAMYRLFRRTSVLQLIERVTKWEVRSGREVLPGDIRKAKEADEKARKEMI